MNFAVLFRQTDEKIAMVLTGCNHSIVYHWSIWKDPEAKWLPFHLNETWTTIYFHRSCKL